MSNALGMPEGVGGMLRLRIDGCMSVSTIKNTCEPGNLVPRAPARCDAFPPENVSEM